MKTRIVKITRENGSFEYQIQQKFLFWWIDAIYGSSSQTTFLNLDQAKNYLCYFDGSKSKVEVMK